MGGAEPMLSRSHIFKKGARAGSEYATLQSDRAVVRFEKLLSSLAGQDVDHRLIG
jgi:hypothetical protein